jgi:cytochrome c5
VSKKHDSQFFNVFSLVIGILVAIALVLFGVARAVGSSTQRVHVLEDAKYQAEVAERVSPMVRVAIAGQDNAALAIVAEGPPPPAVTLVVPTNGEELYKAVCSTCHSAGIAGAPKSGDRAAWGPRIAQGTPTLYKHSIEGFTGKGGVMPAKGGRLDLSDDLIKLGVDYMVELNK